MSRRAWLRLGGLTLGGLALPNMPGAGAASSGPKGIKGVILVLLPGGPTHLDTFDLKPDAPAEIRGEFRPIATNVPGIALCEHLPKLARMADKFALIRSLIGFHDDHNTHWCSTGWESHPAMDASPLVAGFPQGDWPSLGSVLSRKLGERVPGVPPGIDLTPKDADARFIMRTPPGQPGYLGVAHAAFEVQAIDRRNILLNSIDLPRLADRRDLLARFDTFRREADASGVAGDIDAYRQQALTMITSSRLAQALDLGREDARTLRRYGLDRSYPDERDGKHYLDQFLLARRVIEAGARCVTLAFSRWPFGRVLRGDHNWDWHKDLFPEARRALPLLDLGLSGLLEDLDDRGLLNEVAVVVWGEFGRTPRINKNGGRDHWPKVCSALVAGGGMRGGQAIGSTTRWGEEPHTRPVHFREVFATLYQLLGIDVASTVLHDLSRRPHDLVGSHRPLPELSRS
jgi:hypothetical protein